MLCETEKKARRERERGEKLSNSLQNFAGRKKGVGASEKILQNMAAGGFCVSDCSSPPSSFMLPLPHVPPFAPSARTLIFPQRQAVVNVG